MIVALLLVLALFSVPIVNEHYFHIKNLAEIRREAGNRFTEIGELQAGGEVKASRDSLRSLIEYFSRNKDDVSQTAAQLGMYQLAYSIEVAALSAKDYDEAVYEYEKLLKKFPVTLVAEQVFLRIAKCHAAMGNMGANPQGNYRKAIQNLEIIEQNRPEARNFPKYRFKEITPEKYFNIDKGKQFKVNRDLAKAIYTKAEMLREMATDTNQVKAELLSDAVLLIGDCYAKMGRGDSAREQYRIIIDFFQESDLVDDAQKAVGESYEKEADQARQKAETLRDSTEKGALLVRADSLYGRAVDTYLKFINIYRQSDLMSKVFIELGGVYFKIRRDKEAYTTFSQAINSIKVIEDQAKVQLDIGTYYFDQRKWDDAIENYAKVMQNYSNTEFASNAQYLLGDCYKAKGDTTEALKAYQSIVDNFRSSTFYPASAINISGMYIAQKDYVKAQKFLRQSINLFPQSQVAAQTQYQLGEIYMLMADDLDSAAAETKYRLAINEFDLLQQNYDHATEWVEKAILAMGKCYMKLNLKEKARETLDNLRTQALMVEKYRILGIEGSDSSIIKDFQDQLKKFTDDQARAQIYIEIGRKLKGEELNLLDSAVASFQQAISLARDSITIMTAWGEIGDCYIRKGEYKKGRAIFVDEVLNNSRCDEQRRTQFSFKVADTYLRDRNFTEAVRLFTEFIEKYPSHPLAPAAVYFLGKAHAGLEQYGKAREAYDRLFLQYKESDMVDKAALGYGEALQGEKKPGEAVEYLKKFVAAHPGVESMPSFFFKIAEISAKDILDTASCMEYYGKVLKMPDSFLFSAAAFQLGSVLEKQGKDDKAIETYEKVKKDDIEYFRAAQGQIGALKAKTDPEGAIKNYESIENSSDATADKVMSRMGIGDVYAAQKKYPEAVESYRIIYEKYKDAETDLRAVTLIKIIDALNNMGRQDEILNWTDRMIREFPDNKYTVNAYYFRANAYYALKRFGDARETFGEVMRKDSGALAEIAMYQRAECLLSMKKQEESVREFRMFMDRFPKSALVANALFQMANIDWGKENYGEAKRIYQRVVSEYPDFSAICWVKNYMAFCYDKEGSWRKAKEIYNDVRERGCDPEAKQFAKKQIESINVKH